MTVHIDPPHITASDTQREIQQIVDYLYKVSDQLNYILNQIQEGNGNAK